MTQDDSKVYVLISTDAEFPYALAICRTLDCPQTGALAEADHWSTVAERYSPWIDICLSECRRGTLIISAIDEPEWFEMLN